MDSKLEPWSWIAYQWVSKIVSVDNNIFSPDFYKLLRDHSSVTHQAHHIRAFHLETDKKSINFVIFAPSSATLEEVAYSVITN